MSQLIPEDQSGAVHLLELLGSGMELGQELDVSEPSRSRDAIEISVLVANGFHVEFSELRFKRRPVG